jgi:hypothetical protein
MMIMVAGIRVGQQLSFPFVSPELQTSESRPGAKKHVSMASGLRSSS